MLLCSVVFGASTGMTPAGGGLPRRGLLRPLRRWVLIHMSGVSTGLALPELSPRAPTRGLSRMACTCHSSVPGFQRWEPPVSECSETPRQELGGYFWPSLGNHTASLLPRATAYQNDPQASPGSRRRGSISSLSE